MIVRTLLHVAAIAALLGVATGCNLILGTEPPLPLGTGGAGNAPCGDAEWTHWDPAAKHTYDRRQGPDGKFIVVDALTGLAWQTPGDQVAFTYDQAKGHCNTLAWGGLEGYRLPTMVELASLTRYDLAAPSLDPTAFPGEPEGDYWTSSFSNEFDGQACYVSLGDGRIQTRQIETNLTAGVRCVKDLKPAADAGCVRYASADGGEAVRDIETGLVWQRAAVIGTKKWADAEIACATLQLADKTWRLPKVYELITLLDVAANSKSGLDPQFFPVKEIGDYYWSATPAVGADNEVWGVNPATFYAEPRPSSQQLYVRCVR
ncbi:Hypothetical protein A7982_06175 [Minicystis rosea]|nr:Hypothetical protein A7982_06175 [Minicystis rosea]